MKNASLIEITTELVAANTVSHLGNREAMARLGDRLVDAGMRVELQEWRVQQHQKANLVAVAGPAEPDGLILSGHLDVVPFDNQPGWQRDPLRFVAREGRGYGRGASDMKGFLAQCAVAAGRLDFSALRRPLVMLFTADEEIGCLGAERLGPALPELLKDTPAPRLCWIGEPTGWDVFHAHKGVVSFEVRVHGTPGHSSLPEEGVNAIAVAAQLLTRIGALQEELRLAPKAEFGALFPEAPYTTLNFGTVEGGSALNMIADTCTFRLSYRPLPDEDLRALAQRIRARLLDTPALDPGSGRPARIEISEPQCVPALMSPVGSRLGETLCRRFGRTREGGAPYCTDGGRFSGFGIDSIICGPGELAQAHQPNESISMQELEQGVDHVVEVVEELCNRP